LVSKDKGIDNQEMARWTRPSVISKVACNSTNMSQDGDLFASEFKKAIGGIRRKS